MQEDGRAHRRSRWVTPLLWGVAGTLIIGAALGLTLGLRSTSAGPTVAPLVGRTTEPRSAPAILAFARSTPLRLSIPSIGVSVPLVTLGLNSDGTVQVPTNIAEAGWYRFDSTPGQAGTAVILGHVDSYRGPAVFFKLRDLVVGDVGNVTLADRRVARFKVIGTAMYLKTHFPAELVYGARRYSALQLVTCGGVFDHAEGSYLSNVVVYTALVSR